MSVHPYGNQAVPDVSSDSTSPEGPLAHAARMASEEAYLDGLGESQRTAWEHATGSRPQTSSKRLLVALSHTIEKAVMSSPIEDPTIIVAMFQRMAFFDREREVYERMAAAGVHVVVGFISDQEHEPPRGVTTVVLRPDEELADEWTVVAVGPRAGAFLVATDQHSFDPGEREYEASRQFTGRWGYARTPAAGELARLRFALGERLDVGMRQTIDALLARTMPTGAQAAASSGTPGETWATTSLHQVISKMQKTAAGSRELREQLADAQHAAAARTAATVDPHSGLPNADFLQRWSQPSSETSLPVGLALFDVSELDGDHMRGDPRASYHAAHQVAAAMTLPLGPVDAAVRLSAREFLVVVPGASSRHLAGICDAIGEQLELASHGYPDVSLRATLATMVTTSRPLPLEPLHTALSRLQAGGGAGPVDTGTTVGGERIVVASTALHVDGGRHSGTDGPQSGYGPLAAVAPLDDDHHGHRADAGRNGDAGSSDGGLSSDGGSGGGSDPFDMPLPRRRAQATLAELEHQGPDIGVFTDPTEGRQN